MNKFFYSILSYCPNLVLGEYMNIGILMHFPQESKIYFIYPDNFNRLKALNVNTSIEFIDSYCRNIKQKITELSIGTDKNTKEIIEEYLMKPDSVSASFSEIQWAYYTNIEDTIMHYKKNYFNVYKLTKNI